ncbi:MAG: coproporphyrinogen dehydrogenase HemZ, partial [Lachnospiraceae bacterium]|nr:coproporphyrinogen dehydrogenase HemZ [Lachnospiraceae bacterium]
MRILLNSPLFEYDIRGLLQAFFPWEKFETEEAPGEDALSVFFFRTEGDLNLPVLVEDRGVFRSEIRFTFSGKTDSKTVLFDRSDPMAKTNVKKAIYALLSGATKKTLPWGTLTGIRPTKIATEMLEGGSSEEAVKAHLTDDLLVSEGKALLACEIARREKAMLSRFKTEGISLYVGIPFCPTTCLYCSFSSFTIGAYKNRIPEYLDSVEAEIDAVKSLFPNTPVHSVYFGGGTPTSLETADLERLIKKVLVTFSLPEGIEWTVEAGRPDS